MASCDSNAADAPTVSTAEASERGAELPVVVGKKLSDVALDHARHSQFSDILPLVEKDPSLWAAVDDQGHTMLHWAALAGKTDFISAGLAAGADPNVAAHNGQTQLMWAMIRSRIPAAKRLLQARADLYAKDSLGATPLILAIQHSSLDGLLLAMAWGEPSKLLKEGDSKGCTPVHWAAYKGDLQILRLLEYFGADLSVVDDSKTTPLHRAAQGGKPQAVRHLLEKGVKHNLRDKEGKTALDLAVQNNEKAVERMINYVVGAPTKSKKEDNPAENGNGGTVIVDDSSDVEANDYRQVAKDIARRQTERQTRERASRWAAPAFWMMCVSFTYFQYLTDLRALSWRLAPTVALFFEIGGPLSLLLFFVCNLSDPGKLQARHKGSSGVEEILRALKDSSEGAAAPDISRLCTSTFIIKDPRTKYCTVTEACVQEFDHFCGWLNVAIGKGNHRPFICLAFVEVSTQFCYLYLAKVGSQELVQYETFGQFMYVIVTTYPFLAMVAVLHGFTAPGILMLFLNHLRLVAVNMTTNEIMNANRYEHFWTDVPDPRTGQLSKRFRNPFSKGSMLMNCLDFWIARRRSEFGSCESACSGCACKH
eukprot:TRINITY_DN112694_c0_g1_i1.p1 TRINITY_DN112694_c0_g1~~TRINITY_DN112694_c0_g1_i1.p1  ORF type:complete len:594 (-),score=87.01 TRINITY_DN112694_c0_g1_i1:68-1849(-)